MHKLIENTSQLRPCPFCGVKRQVVDVHDKGPLLYGRSSFVGAVHCPTCGARIEGRALTIEKAVTLAMLLWNTRVPEDQQPITHQGGRARA